MTPERFSELLKKYTDDSIELKEQDELFAALATGQHNTALDEQVQNDMEKVKEGSLVLPPHVAQEMVRNIFASEASTLHVLPKKNIFPMRRWMAVAAIFLLLLSSGLYFLYPKQTTDVGQLAFVQTPVKEIINREKAAKTLMLPDGSVVWLQPGSRLQYPEKFAGGQREVVLHGEAMFNVARDEKKPFFVYYKDIVTKVLGTSFTIRTNTIGNPEVMVQSGKVQVYTQATSGKKGNNAVILTPNQKAVYDRQKNVLSTALVERPMPVNVQEAAGGQIESTQLQFTYEQSPLADVLTDLEKRYGVQLVAEKEALYHCLFTGDLSSGDLFEQLQIICLTVDASYEINGTTVLIKGRGCGL